MIMRAAAITVIVSLLVFQQPPVFFQNITRQSGIRFQSVSGAPQKNRITDVNGSGAAFIDYDRDGFVDIYIVNGARENGDTPGNALYRNLGDGTFKDVTESARVRENRWGMGVVAADFDNDGWPDLYLTNYGRNTLYRNTGKGTFVDVTEQAGVGKVGYSTGAAFGDYDRDGWLDLFVSNYIEFDPKLPIASGKGCSYKGIPVFCGPGGFKGGANILYHNNHDGTFTDVTAAAGVVALEPHYSFTAAFEDFDDDGWPDLFVANDSTPNYLYRNLGNGRFKEIGLESGVALSDDGRAQAGMGVAVGDYDNDGRSDIVVTNFSDDISNLYRNLGKMLFVDQSYPAGIGRPSIPMLKWGVLLEDFDNDGFKDILVANGHIYPEVDAHPVNTTFKQTLQLFRNKDGRFQEISGAAGLQALGPLSARAAIAGDIDNDGGIDVLITQLDGEALLIANKGVRGHWVTFELEGRKSNRSAVGARIHVRTGQREQWNSVRSGGSFISQNDLRVHFGLAEATMIDRVDVSWPSGLVTHLENVAPDRVIKLLEPEK